MPRSARQTPAVMVSGRPFTQKTTSPTPRARRASRIRSARSTALRSLGRTKRSSCTKNTRAPRSWYCAAISSATRSGLRSRKGTPISLVNAAMLQ